jgi:molybdopterin-guanine dinucleotide biosynthesis protein A
MTAQALSALARLPVFGICGWSGAGKTTLILELLRRLRARGLATLVLKHDAHGLDVDRAGKDTSRFFDAGADVLARDATQCFARTRRGDKQDLPALVRAHACDYDVVLIEGHKSTPLPRKIWLRRHARDRAPASARPIDRDLGRDDARVEAAWRWLDDNLDAIHLTAPTMAGILIGGQSRRMGASKHLLKHHGRTWLAHLIDAASEATDGVALLGAGRVPPTYARLPRLPDAPGMVGPIAGMCAALRWAPFTRWLFLACDTPLLSASALTWLKQQSRPGVWAVEPRLTEHGHPEPLPGWYDFRARSLLEHAPGPSWLARDARAATPVIPTTLAPSWINCNTPASVRKLSKRR